MKKGLILASCFLLLVSADAVQAQSVDLLWQGETYTSPFYKGGSLWSSQSRITLVAIPHGLGDQRNLSYKWTKSGTVLGNINGVGVNTISFTDSVLSKPQVIKVDIVDTDKTVLASASAIITPLSPSLVVYENNPLYGFMFHKEVSKNYKLEEKETTFAAFPFFFSVLDRADGVLDYEWRTNAGGRESRASVTYRAPDDTSGSSEIKVRVANKKAIMQSAGKDFLIQFENN